MFATLKRIWRPEVFHGPVKKGPFFEGWFYKFVNPAKTEVFAVIPGIYYAPNPAESHAFIQILNGQDHQSHYLQFPITQFQAAQHHFEVNIGANQFQRTGIRLNLQSANCALVGNLRFQALKPWPITLTAPGIMGWYALVPGMQCYHGVLSLDHSLAGTLTYNRQTIDFNGGRGYLEKDWGRSFPRGYIWIQSNHFQQENTALMVSIAHIPWLTRAFRGFLIGFLLNGHLYRFTSYTGAHLETVHLTPTEIQITVADQSAKLVITAQRTAGGYLHGPYSVRMIQRVAESLRSQVAILFYRRRAKDWELICQDVGKPAGLDLNGNLKDVFDSIAT